jgi:hypothetical protein
MLNAMTSLSRRIKINRLGAMAIVAVLAGTIAFATVELARPTARASRVTGIQGPPGPTLAEPIADAQKTTLATARSALGVAAPLPTTSAVRPADVGAVWESGGTPTIMALTYPSQGLIIDYTRPAVPSADQEKTYQQVAAEVNGNVIELNGTTPALEIAQNSDMTGANFGVVAFVVNGTEVRVMGHTDGATLEAIAQSILTQWPSTSSSTPSGTSSSPRG